MVCKLMWARAFLVSETLRLEAGRQAWIPAPPQAAVNLCGLPGLNIDQYNDRAQAQCSCQSAAANAEKHLLDHSATVKDSCALQWIYGFVIVVGWRMELQCSQMCAFRNLGLEIKRSSATGSLCTSCHLDFRKFQSSIHGNLYRQKQYEWHGEHCYRHCA